MKNNLLCDIGNTTFSFSNGDKVSVERFDISSISDEVYYISVNHYWEKRLDMQENWINLRDKLDFSKYYESMGIDRVICCEAVENAMVLLLLLM